MRGMGTTPPASLVEYQSWSGFADIIPPVNEIAVDGKTHRRSHDRKREVKAEEKWNEINEDDRQEEAYQGGVER